jgi:hypothetical protein
MYKYIVMVFVTAIMMMVIHACKKDKTPPEPEEEQLRVSTNAAALNEIAGPATDFNLTVESVMPPTGVKIKVVVRGEIDNLVYYTGPLIESFSKITKVDILNLPKQKICTCSIEVVSKTRSTNSATANFRVVYK